MGYEYNDGVEEDRLKPDGVIVRIHGFCPSFVVEEINAEDDWGGEGGTDDQIDKMAAYSDDIDIVKFVFERGDVPGGEGGSEAVSDIDAEGVVEDLDGDQIEDDD
ncbi:unnamed protein product [Sphagnum balticum]